MKPKNDRTMLYIFASLAVIFLGIVATTVINQQKQAGGDIRAKASAEAGAKYEAVVTQVNPDSGTLVVGNLQPNGNAANNYGTWTVTPPAGYNYAAIPQGSTVVITVDAQTFLITKHTLTAKKIETK